MAATIPIRRDSRLFGPIRVAAAGGIRTGLQQHGCRVGADHVTPVAVDAVGDGQWRLALLVADVRVRALVDQQLRKRGPADERGCVQHAAPLVVERLDVTTELEGELGGVEGGVAQRRDVAEPAVAVTVFAFAKAETCRHHQGRGLVRRGNRRNRRRRRPASS